MRRFGRLSKKIIALLCILSIIIESNVMIFAVTLPTITKPPVLKLKTENGKYSIKMDTAKDWHKTNLEWSTTFPNIAENKYINIYMKEHDKAYRALGERVLVKENIDIDDKTHKVDYLKSGTIYDFDASTQYSYKLDGMTYNSDESPSSKIVSLLTDMKVVGYPISEKKVKIVWDDVWYKGKRINYELLISDNVDFSSAQSTRILSDSEVGPTKRVNSNEADGKLEYIFNAGNTGRIYYVKIRPLINITEVTANTDVDVIQISTYIFGSSKKLSDNGTYEDWRLQWTKCFYETDSLRQVSYDIYEGDINTGSTRRIVEGTRTNYCNLNINDDNRENFFRVVAVITRGGKDEFKIDIESDRIFIGEEDISYYPKMPEILDTVEKVSGETLTSYEKELGADNATIFWRAPLKGDGTVDFSIKYDIWLISDPDLIEEPPESERIEELYTVPSTDYVMDGTEILAYKYKITNRTPNSVYYFKIVAKREFNVFVNDKLIIETVLSESANKVIITKTMGNIDKPIAPNQPPFKIKEDVDGKIEVTSNSISIQFKDKWYEKYDNTDQSWKYYEPDTEPQASVVDNVYLRKIQYDNDVAYDIGCEVIQDGASYLSMRSLMNTAKYKIVGESAIPNDPLEDLTKNYDGKRHNIIAKIQGLTSKTLYLVWIKVYRKSAVATSSLSEPLVIDTSESEGVIQNPVIPTFKVVASNYYADIMWDFKPLHDYNIKYGTVDDINEAKDLVELKATDLVHLYYYRILNLKPATEYYFWMQAVIVTENMTSKSEWSDSYYIKTIESAPPYRPTGFGVKNAAGAVTTNSITFEWINVPNLDYYIEYANNSLFKNLLTAQASKNSEFEITKLSSNTKYFARIYAFDSVKKLKSDLSLVISIKTLIDESDIDSLQNNIDDTEIEGFREELNVTDGALTVNIDGANADVFIKKLAKNKDNEFIIDLSQYKNKSKSLNIIVTEDVINAADKLRESFSIYDGKLELVIFPGALKSSAGVTGNADPSKIKYEILLEKSEDKTILSKELKAKQGPLKLTIKASDGNTVIPITKLSIPVKVISYFDTPKWYVEGVTNVYIYDEIRKIWDAVESKGYYEEEKRKGSLSFKMDRPATFIISDKIKEIFKDIKNNKYQNSVNNVSSKYTIKSIEGNNFVPDENAKKVDVVKFIMDVLGYDYDGNFMMSAYKADLIDATALENPVTDLIAKDAFEMILRLYEIKTGRKFSDETQRKAFIDKNLLSIAGSNEAVLTRGQTIALIEKVLVVIGEL